MALKKINELGGKLRLVGTQPKVEAMFKLTKMNKFFEVLDTREDALDSFM
jgi:anti-anti-sigma regulatory factor